MTVPQITIRVTPDVKAKFEAYAKDYGLDTSALAKLLIVRERHRRYLLKFRDKEMARNGRRRPNVTSEKMDKITAHVSTVEVVKEFDSYARACGLNRGRAGALLLETELRDRWLEKAVTTL